MTSGGSDAAILNVPSGTTMRFATLVALAVASTLFIFGSYAESWPVTTFLDNTACQVKAELYLTSTGVVDPDESRWAAYRDCMSGLVLPRLGWLFGGLLALFAVAAGIYRARPAWRIRRSRLERLDLSPALREKLREPLAELVARAGLRQAPEFLLDPASTRAGGVAFGRRRRPVVCLDAGLVALVDRDRATFDAVVLHELAHVRNGDVATTYATLAVWRAFLLVALLPYTVLQLNPLLFSKTPLASPVFFALSSPITQVHLLRLVAMVVLAYLARTAVLRSRERYADALVARWTGTSDPYAALTDSPRRRRVLRWIAIHPSAAARVAAMRDPRSLLRPGFWEVLLSALAVQLAWSNLTGGLSTINWYRAGNESFLVMRVVWGVVIGALVCVVAWRGSAYRRAGGTGRGTFALPGLALGLGVVLGLNLSVRTLSPPALLPVAAILVAAVLVSCWAGYCVGLLGDRVRGPAGLLTACAIVVVCVSCLGWAHESVIGDLAWRDFVGPALALHPPVVDAALVPFVLNSERVLTAAALALLWLVPLASGRGVRFGLLAGLVGAAGWIPVVFAVRAVAGSDPLALSAWELIAVFGVQLVLAVVVARQADWAVALLATWVVGVVGCVGIWLLHLADWQVDSVLAARPLQVLPFAGTVAALLGAAVVRGWRAPSADQAWRPGRLALACLVLVSAPAVVWWPSAPKATELLAPPVPAVVNQDEAVNIWIYGGGWNRFMAVMTANNEVFQAFSAQDVPRIVSACENVLAPVREGVDFPKPPGEQVRTTWTTALASIEPGARECLRIYRDGSGDGDLMVTSFRASLDQLGQTLTLLNEARDRALQVGGG